MSIVVDDATLESCNYGF